MVQCCSWMIQDPGPRMSGTGEGATWSITEGNEEHGEGKCGHKQDADAMALFGGPRKVAIRCYWDGWWCT